MLKVMVVDDDYLVRQGIIRVLPWEQFGMEVVCEASNGLEALECLNECAVDLLITDLAMPVMSGLELIKHVKEKHPQIHLVVLTFHHEFDLIRDSLRLGVLDYITKVELEDDQMAPVLQRIRERIESAPLPPRHAPAAPTNQDDVVRISRQWSGLAWLTNDDLFAEMLEQTESLHLPAAQLEQMMALAMEEWEVAVGRKLPLPREDKRPSAWSEWKVWLHDIRNAFYGQTNRYAYSAEIVSSVLKAIDYVKRNVNEDLQLPDIAHHVGMSRSYFSRCFRDISGKTFQEFVRDLRIEHAKKLLRHSHRSISWIAAESGYPNERYFSRVFREMTGMIPRDYRRQHHQSSKKS